MNNKRTEVRASIEFDIKFKVISDDEYKRLRERQKRRSVSFSTQGINLFGSEEAIDTIVLQSIIELLINMDNKLDSIYEILSSGKKELTDNYLRGTGVDISGSGLRMVTEQNLPTDTLIYANFILSRFPFVYIELFGKVVRCRPITIDKKQAYSVAINFVDIFPEDREKIIECVFQKQRQTLREKRAKEIQ